MLNIKEMIDGEPARLRYVYRYSTSRTQHRESVAEHSWFVTFYALQIATYLNSVHPGIADMELLLPKAILHDVEEARSGDFPRPFKYSDPNLKAMLDEASSLAAGQVLGPMWTGSGRNPLHDMITAWTTSKDDSVEGSIVEFCDFLSVLGFLMHEFAGGNKTIERHVADMSTYFERFLGKDYNFMRELIVQAGNIMNGVFSGERTESKLQP